MVYSLSSCVEMDFSLSLIFSLLSALLYLMVHTFFGVQLPLSTLLVCPPLLLRFIGRRKNATSLFVVNVSQYHCLGPRFAAKIAGSFFAFLFVDWLFPGTLPAAPKVPQDGSPFLLFLVEFLNSLMFTAILSFVPSALRRHQLPSALIALAFCTFFSFSKRLSPEYSGPVLNGAGGLGLALALASSSEPIPLVSWFMFISCFVVPGVAASAVVSLCAAPWVSTVLKGRAAPSERHPSLYGRAAEKQWDYE